VNPVLDRVSTCNRCGLCCTSKRGDRVLYCEYLDRTVCGEPDGTQCRVYAQRVHLMPIRMLYEDGEVARQSRCLTGEPDETNGIRKKGLGSRCSLTGIPRT
jgi:uncharacterized cysteine cluster protein YcgN (CxxCxxCC family)